MIWLIGGTSESVVVAKLLAYYQRNFIISVTTENARNLYKSIEDCYIIVGKFSPEKIDCFIEDYAITHILDCSHPFAAKISQSVIDCCQSLKVIYLRYERDLVDYHDRNFPKVILTDWDSLVNRHSPLEGKRVLLTIGAKYLPKFINYQSRATLYARILPYPESLQLAYQGGFTCERIIALRPPITPELEAALWRQWQIEIVVAKAGGKLGGETIKYQVAQELDLTLVVISRPQINYPRVTNQLSEVENFIAVN